ncbi:MAG: AGE family epimerase/isomerase, partial [Planctomycetota bacterium]
MEFTELKEFLTDQLVDNIVPFWLGHSMDYENGGMFTCIEDDGTLISTDKYIWSNARALWTFSAMVNRID